MQKSENAAEAGSSAHLVEETRKEIPPAAQRALAEAQARREAEQAQNDREQNEINGPKGPEPTRYGDWEKAGRAYDF